MTTITTISLAKTKSQATAQRRQFARALRAGTKTWGRWRFNPQVLTLEINSGRHEYEVDLEQCCSITEIYDWLAQVGQKTWIAPEDIGQLFLAIDELYGHNSQGMKNRINARAYFRRLLRSPRDPFSNKAHAI